jgi:hypothetical protein
MEGLSHFELFCVFAVDMGRLRVILEHLVRLSLAPVRLLRTQIVSCGPVLRCHREVSNERGLKTLFVPVVQLQIWAIPKLFHAELGRNQRVLRPLSVLGVAVAKLGDHCHRGHLDVITSAKLLLLCVLILAVVQCAIELVTDFQRASKVPPIPRVIEFW